METSSVVLNDSVEALLSFADMQDRQSHWRWQLWSGAGSCAQAHKPALCLQDYSQAAQEGSGNP